MDAVRSFSRVRSPRTALGLFTARADAGIMSILAAIGHIIHLNGCVNQMNYARPASALGSRCDLASGGLRLAHGKASGHSGDAHSRVPTHRGPPDRANSPPTGAFSEPGGTNSRTRHDFSPEPKVPFGSCSHVVRSRRFPQKGRVGTMTGPQPTACSCPRQTVWKHGTYGRLAHRRTRPDMKARATGERCACPSAWTTSPPISRFGQRMIHGSSPLAQATGRSSTSRCAWPSHRQRPG